jgi:hypothetical protein
MKKNIKIKKFELKSFKALMEKRLTKEEIQMIKEQTSFEFKALKYISRSKISFDKLRTSGGG